jgi:hypothetical protein
MPAGMNRGWVMAVGIVTVWQCGCSNAPLAGTLDCVFPSRGGRPSGPKLPDSLFDDPPAERLRDRLRDRSRDPLPEPDMRDIRPRDGGLEGLPKIGDPFPTDDQPRGRRDANTTNDTRLPLPAPTFPGDR